MFNFDWIICSWFLIVMMMMIGMVIWHGSGREGYEAICIQCYSLSCIRFFISRVLILPTLWLVWFFLFTFVCFSSSVYIQMKVEWMVNVLQTLWCRAKPHVSCSPYFQLLVISICTNSLMLSMEKMLQLGLYPFYATCYVKCSFLLERYGNEWKLQD